MATDGSRSDDLAHMSNTLDFLTALRWDLQNGLRDGVAAPQEIASDLERVFRDLDVAIAKLKEVIRMRGLPV